MTHHLAHAPCVDKPAGRANRRNGSSGKTVLTADGPRRIDVARERHGDFDLQIVGKHERRFTGFDDKIIALFARLEAARRAGALVEDVRRRCQSRSGQHCHGRHNTRGNGVAKPATRTDGSSGVLRRVAHQGP